MKPRRWKRLLLYAGMGIIILVLFLFFARPLYLPDHKLTHRLQQAISSAAGLNIEIERGSFSLLEHALLEGIAVRDSGGKLIAFCRELRVNYRPLSLLEKRLHLEELILIDPVIYVHAVKRDSVPVKQTLPSDSGPEFAAAELSSTDVSSGSPFNFALPVALQIDRLQVWNARLEVRQGYPNASLEIELRGVNLTGDEIYLHDESNSRLQLVIDIADSLRLKSTTSHLSHGVQADVAFSANATITQEMSTLDIELEAHPLVQVSSRYLTFPAVSLSAESVLNSLQDLTISEMSISLGDVLNVALAANLEDIFGIPAFQANLSAGYVNIESALSILTNMSIVDSLVFPRIAGNLAFEQSQIGINRSHSDLEIEGMVRCCLRDGSFLDPVHGIALQNLSFDAFVEGNIFPLVRMSLDAGIDLRADQCITSRSLKETPLTFSQVDLGISAKILPQLASPELSLVWRSGASFGAGLRGSLFARADTLDPQKPHLSPGLYLETGFSVEDLDLRELVEEDMGGSLEIAADMTVQSLDDIALAIGVLCPDLSLGHSGGTLNVPPLLSRLSMQGSTSPNLTDFHASRLHFDISPYGEIDMSASLFENQRWEMTGADLTLNLSEIAPVFKPLFPKSLESLNVHGTIAVNGSGEGQLNASRDSHAVLKVSSDDLSLDFQRQRIALDSIRLQTDVQLVKGMLAISSSADIRQLTFAEGAAGSYRDIALNAQGRLRRFGEIAGTSAELASERLGLKIQFEAEPGEPNAPTLSGINIRYRFKSADSVRIFNDVIASGQSEGKCRIAFSSDSVHQVEGMVSGEELNLSIKDEIDLSGLTFRLPFRSEVAAGKTGICLPSRESMLSSDDDPVIFSSFEHLATRERGLGEVRCRKIRAGDYVFENLSGIIGFNQGALEVPKLTLDGYGGTIQGALNMGLFGIDPDSVQYWVKVAGIGLNSAHLPGVKSGEGEKSEISAFAHFKGVGLNPNGRFDLEGGLDITQIGREVADNILRFLDPDQNDPSIRTYRNYIRRGWGVKVFSFDVKEDFVYVSITPARPPLSQLDMFLLSHIVGLGRSVTFGRLPLRYFLESKARPASR